jgi:hypothetical protein
LAGAATAAYFGGPAAAPIGYQAGQQFGQSFGGNKVGQNSIPNWQTQPASPQRMNWSGA